MPATAVLHDETLSLRDRKKIRTRTELIDATLQSFNARGYTETKINDIAAAAMVSRGTLFNYFSSKEGIVLAWASDLHAAIRTAIEERSAALDAPEALLKALAEMILYSITLHPKAIRALIGMLYAPDGERTAEAWATFDLNALITPIITMGQKTGEFRRDIAVEKLGAFVASALLLQLVALGEEEVGPAGLHDAMTLVLAALRSPSR